MSGIELSIPGWKDLHLQHVVLDVNGTIALDGRLMDGVSVRIRQLGEVLQVHLLTADTHGRQSEIDALLGIKAHCVSEGMEASQKSAYVRELDGHVAVVGNGANDADMLRAADLGLAILGPEGLAYEALRAADVMCSSPIEALGLLLTPDRLRATLRR